MPVRATDEHHPPQTSGCAEAGVAFQISASCTSRKWAMKNAEDSKLYVRWLEDLGANDVPVVGGKNASLGEMVGSLKQQGVRVPGGFATTADAYWEFLTTTGCKDKISQHLKKLNDGKQSLENTGRAIRRIIRQASFPPAIAKAIGEAYAELSRRHGKDEVDVAVRSSATAEDLPSASFAGQQDTYLNITGSDEVLEACRDCYASLFTDRAISYREEQRFEHLKVALSVGVQHMVRSDKASSGVMFTIDTETGFPEIVVINAT
jgi:pyruvate, water dikinase